MNNENKKEHNDDLYLKELLFLLWDSKIVILSSVLLLTTLSIIFSLLITDTYKSETILASADDDNSLSKLSSQYSGLASIAGISLPTSESNDVEKGIEIMKSYNFFENFVSKNNLLYNLLAPNNWDSKNNELIINPNIYDVTNKKWVSKERFSVDGVPSMQSAHKKFKKNISISTNKQNGFISISFEHYSPYVAKNILDLLVHDINEILRNEQINQSEMSIKFLKDEIQKTEFAEVRVGLNRLIQSQTEKIMIANATPEFLFKVLSPPIVTELKHKPKRSTIVIISFLFSIFLSSFIIIIRNYFFNKSFS